MTEVASYTPRVSVEPKPDQITLLAGYDPVPGLVARGVMSDPERPEDEE